MLRRLTRLCPVCVLLSGLSLVALTAACGDGAPRQTLVSPAVSPAPPDVVVDMAQADRLYHDGSFEEAVTIYSAAVLRGSPEQRQEGLWRLARVQYKRGDSKAAEQNLKVLLQSGPTPAQRPPALLLLGMAELAQGKTGEAREHLRQYLDAGGPAAPYAHLRLAQLAAGEGHPDAATEEIDRALAAALPASTEAEARFALASYQEQDHDDAAAMATYDALAADAAGETDRAEALWKLAGLADRSGEAERSRLALVQLVQQYPWHDRALEALGRPHVAFAFSTRERALVLFRQHEDDLAAAAFQTVIEQSAADAGEAHYYLAILAERRGDYAGALPEYDQGVALLQPGGDTPFLGQVLWDRALLHESEGRLEAAAGAYAEIADLAPSSQYAASGLFKAGLQRYRQGRFQEAFDAWARYLTEAPEAEGRAQAHFWLARAAQQLPDPKDAAGLHLAQAMAQAPLDYYGLRAAAMRSGQAAFPDAGDPEPPAPDWNAVEQWLAGWAGPEDVAARGDMFAGGYWTRGLALLYAGLEKDGAAELEALLSQAEGDPWLLYRLSRALAEEGLASLSARAGGLLLLLRADAPPAAVALAYPLEYLELVQKFAADSHVSPLLLLALVRQESLYDPDAVSPAAATGLTQVIPGTAAEIAGQLNEPGFRNADLLRPHVSLRFGAHYLGAQLEGFGGDVPAALAAYNGGAGNAGRWYDAAGGDPDVFLESIDFTETRAYVERVLENYARYLYAYGLMQTPSLPL
ncbi:MAG: transglycosylase SLT domain-containing protein [Dehalococcoidia bacterium]|nr:transglycosylase SLT domain-containing protein [Dehalococcoidia bacterium]